MSFGEDDPGWDELLRQVDAALGDLGLDGQEIREAVAEGLRQAMDELHEGDPQPEVVVLDGGRKEAGGPPGDSPRPELRVEPGGGGRSEGSAGRSSVRVFRVPLPARGDLRGAGRIRVQADGGWQTVLRACRPRPYRLLCGSGSLLLELDGKPAGELQAGQSTDVEARVLRVAAAGGRRAEGSYVRLAE